MARIVGVDIPRNKKVPYSLSYIHGIGLTTAKLLCQEAKVDILSLIHISEPTRLLSIADGGVGV